MKREILIRVIHGEGHNQSLWRQLVRGLFPGKDGLRQLRDQLPIG